MPWDIDTLKVYVDGKIDALKDSFDSKVAAMEKAVSKAEDQLTKRFESVNEFRAMAEDQNRTQMPRLEAEKEFESLKLRVEKLEMERINHMGTEAGTHAGYIWAIGVVALIATIFGIMGVIGGP